MAADLYVQVIGADQLKRIIGQVNDGFERKALADANKKAAEVVVRRALPNVPVRSGKLKASVKAMSTPKKGNVRAGTPSRVPYAAAIHWGRKRGGVIPARPFLWNAKSEALESGELEKAYADACNDLINQFF